MIPSARSHSPTSGDHCFHATFVLRYFEKWRQTYGQKTCENNDHYQPELWVGRVDQKTFYNSHPFQYFRLQVCTFHRVARLPTELGGHSNLAVSSIRHRSFEETEDLPMSYSCLCKVSWSLDRLGPQCLASTNVVISVHIIILRIYMLILDSITKNGRRS